MREFERLIQRGQRFHRLAQQYLVGLPPERLALIAAADEDECLPLWWRNFVETIPPRINGDCYIETELAAPFHGFRLVAVYDLISVSPNGKLTIYDWKTSLRRPNSASLRNRMQSRIYPYLLTQAGASL